MKKLGFIYLTSYISYFIYYYGFKQADNFYKMIIKLFYLNNK